MLFRPQSQTAFPDGNSRIFHLEKSVPTLLQYGGSRRVGAVIKPMKFTKIYFLEIVKSYTISGLIITPKWSDPKDENRFYFFLSGL
jgi:hypothetical protein